MLAGMANAILFCADPLHPGRVDEHFSAEAGAVRDAGGRIGLIDHDALLRGDVPAAVRRVPPDLGPAWYRGWMVPSARYRDLARALDERGVKLLDPPEVYRRAHELPGWYDRFAAVTPRSVWLPAVPGEPPSTEELAALVAPLGGGPAIVKDYVKSRKHEWDEACFVPEVDDLDATYRVVRRFVELQEDALAGGIVLRTFETFTTSEARVWWLDGRTIAIGPHPDSPDRYPATPELGRVGPLVAALGCRFVTTDLVRRDDGEWRVVEVGDGQVSDLPRGLDPAEIIGALVG